MDQAKLNEKVANYAKSYVALHAKALKTRQEVDHKRAGEAYNELVAAINSTIDPLAMTAGGEHGSELMDLAIQIHGFSVNHPAYNQCRYLIEAMTGSIIALSRLIKTQYEAEQQNVRLNQFAEELKAAVKREDLAPLDIIDGIKQVVREGLGE
jgi:hypothetical protein